MHLLAIPNLREDRERDKPVSLTGSPEPTVGYHRLIVFPFAEKLEVLGHAEDVEAFVGPDFAPARGIDGPSAALGDVVARAGELRDRGRGRTVTLKIRLRPFKTYTRSRTLPARTVEEDTVAATALELLERFDPRTPVRLVGVGVAGLVSEEVAHQPGQLAV